MASRTGLLLGTILLYPNKVKNNVLTMQLIVHTVTSSPSVLVLAWRMSCLASGTILVTRCEWKIELVNGQKMEW